MHRKAGQFWFCSCCWCKACFPHFNENSDYYIKIWDLPWISVQSVLKGFNFLLGFISFPLIQHTTEANPTTRENAFVLHIFFFHYKLYYQYNNLSKNKKNFRMCYFKQQHLIWTSTTFLSNLIIMFSNMIWNDRSSILRFIGNQNIGSSAQLVSLS